MLNDHVVHVNQNQCKDRIGASSWSAVPSFYDGELQVSASGPHPLLDIYSTRPVVR